MTEWLGDWVSGLWIVNSDTLNVEVGEKKKKNSDWEGSVYSAKWRGRPLTPLRCPPFCSGSIPTLISLKVPPPNSVVWASHLYSRKHKTCMGFHKKSGVFPDRVWGSHKNSRLFFKTWSKRGMRFGSFHVFSTFAPRFESSLIKGKTVLNKD